MPGVRWVKILGGVLGVACAALTTREFGDWAKEAWPRLADAVLAELHG